MPSTQGYSAWHTTELNEHRAKEPPHLTQLCWFDFKPGKPPRLARFTPVLNRASPTVAQHPASVLSLISSYGFEETVAGLKMALTTHGLTIFADIDQRAAATQAGLALRPTRLLLFGNPASGTPIMEANPHAALELPLKAVVWQDKEQLVHLDYQDAGQVLTAHYSVGPELTSRLAAVPALLQKALASK